MIVPSSCVAGPGRVARTPGCPNHPFTSSAGALRGPKPPGRPPRPAHRRAPRNATAQADGGAPDRWLRRARLLEFVPLRRPRDNAVGLLHEEMRRCGSLIMRAADAQAAGGRRARRRSRWVCGRGDGGGRTPSAHHGRARRDRRPPAGRTGRTSSSPPGRSPRRPWPPPSRRSPAKTTLPSSMPSLRSFTRESIDMEVAWRAVALRQGGAGRHRRGLPQLPDGPSAVRGASSMRCSRARRRVQRVGATALLRRLPADRGDGRARPETLRFGPMKPVGLTDPRNPARSPTRWCSCARTMRSARCGTWSASRPS